MSKFPIGSEFDGKNGELSAPSNVLVKGNVIERISESPIAAEPSYTVIDGKEALD